MRSPLTRRLLVAGVLAWSACGGSTESRAPAAAGAPAPGTRLALGAGKVTWSAPGHYSMQVVLHADGNLDLSATYRERPDGPDQTAGAAHSPRPASWQSTARWWRGSARTAR